MPKLSFILSVDVDDTTEPNLVAQDIEQALLTNEDYYFQDVQCTPGILPSFSPSGAAAPQTPLVVPPTQQTTT